jgi:hypothetical protein
MRGLWLGIWLVSCGGDEAVDDTTSPTDDSDDSEVVPSTDSDTLPDDSGRASTDTVDTVDTASAPSADTATAPHTGGSSTADTGLPATLLSASCQLQSGNVLRVDCEAVLDGPGDVLFTLSAPGLPDRTVQGAGELVQATVLGLRADTVYDYTVSAGGVVQGTVATGSLPTGVGTLTTTVVGSSDRIDAVMSPFACDGIDGLVAYDSEGEVVWYETVPATGRGGLGGVTGYDLADDGTLLVAWDADVVRSQTLGGEVHFEVSGLPDPQHHDVATDGTWHWLLHGYEQGGSVIDGFTVLDADGVVVDSWRYGDHVTVPPPNSAGGFWGSVFPGADDWSHGNGLELDGDHLLLSMRFLDAVVRVGGIPGSADFGVIDWTLTGQPGNDVDSDAAFASGGYEGQHHAMRWPDGRLAVFDNRVPQTTSRGLLIDLDVPAGTAAESDDYVLDRYCSTQGSFYPADDGAVLTCEPAGQISVFAPGAAVAELTMTVRCPVGGGMPMGTFARGLPVSF